MDGTNEAEARDRASGDAPLLRLAALAEDAELPGFAAEARAIAERVTEGRFYVACVGQFKRGKSTLLNALVDQSVLPTGVLPVTAVVTVLRYSPSLRVLVRLERKGWQEVDPDELRDYVSEERNPENERGVDAVEVFVPSPLLASGLCLVDTPGIGSVFLGNTEATRAFVPHVDAALVVLGADPPVSAEELALVDEVSRHVRDLVFVLNKADHLTEVEQHEAATFTARVVARRLGRIVPPPLEVNAFERLTSGPTRDWTALEEALAKLAAISGAQLVADAEKRGVELVAGRLLHELEERHGALVRPIDESRRRVAKLRRIVTEAERAVADLSHLLDAEQQRLLRRFEERQAQFLSRASAQARAELDRAISEADVRRTSRRRQALSVAQEVARHHLEPWLAEQQALAEREYREAMARFVELANQFLDRLEGSDTALAGIARLGPEAGFRVKSGYFSTERLRLTTPSPWTWIADLLRPSGRLTAAIRADDAPRRRLGRDRGDPIFRAPLSGAIMGVESPYKHDLALDALLPSLVAAATSFWSFTQLRPATPHFPVTFHYALSSRDLLIAVPLGLSAGLASNLFLGTLGRIRKWFGDRAVPTPIKTGLGGLLLVGIAYAAFRLVGKPVTLQAGLPVANELLNGHYALSACLLIFVLKLLATSVTFGSGGVGGLFVPTATIGAAVGACWDALLPGSEPGVHTLIGIAAFSGASYNSLLFSAVFIAEATGNVFLVVPVLVASTFAFLTTAGISNSRAQRHRRPDAEEALALFPIEKLMTKRIVTVHPEQTLEAFAHSVLLDHHFKALPVIDEGAIDLRPPLRSRCQPGAPRRLVRLRARRRSGRLSTRRARLSIRSLPGAWSARSSRGARRVTGGRPSRT